MNYQLWHGDCLEEMGTSTQKYIARIDFYNPIIASQDIIDSKRNKEPKAELVYDDEKCMWWQAIPEDKEWVHLGFCKAPRTRWQTFWYHFHHGMLMGYGFWNVVKFSLMNLNSFEIEVFIELDEWQASANYGGGHVPERRVMTKTPQGM